MAADSYPLLQLFWDLPKAQIFEIRDRALCLIGEGKTIMEVQSRGGQMSQKRFSMPPDRIVFEANAALRHLSGRRRTRTYARLSAF